MPRCHIALGGNVGDVARAIEVALERLAGAPGVQVKETSSVFRTRPVGRQAGGTFSNAAAALETGLDPLALLDLLQDLERRAGRAPSGRWTPRPLDLDLIFYGEATIDRPRLCVPHPACWYRRFVLDPLATIAAEVRHPVKGLSVAELQSRLLKRPLSLALAGSALPARQGVRRALAALFPDVEIFDWRGTADAEGEPTILAWLGPAPASPPNATTEEGLAEFLALPLVPRLDLSAVPEVVSFLRDVLESASG